MRYRTVNIREETHRALRALSLREGRPILEIIARMTAERVARSKAVPPPTTPSA